MNSTTVLEAQRYTLEEAQVEGDWMRRAAQWHANRKIPLWQRAVNAVTFRQQPTQTVDYQAAERILALATIDHLGISKSAPHIFLKVLAGEIDFSQINTRSISLWSKSQPILG